MSFDEQTSALPGINDQQRLGIFVWMVYEDLDSVVAIRRVLFDGGGYLDFIDILPAAWGEVTARREEVLGAVLGVDLADLRNAGLTDAALLAKLEAWSSARDRMLDEFEVGGPEILPRPGEPPPPPTPPPTLVGRLRRWLRRRRPLRRKRALQWLARTLAHADNILDSLTAVVPVAGPVKESKKAIERVADDTADSLADDS